MKNKFIVLLVILIMLALTVALIIYIPKTKVVEKIIENNVTEFYLCEGTYCKNRQVMPEYKETEGNCEICNRKIESENIDIDKLCENCSKSGKKCKHCGEQIAKDKLEENNRKRLQMAKYNKINIVENKIALIKDTNKMVFLTKDYGNKENNNSILVFYDMLENKEIEKVDLKADYMLKGPEITFDILQELENGMDLTEAQKIYKQQEKEKMDYEALGRLFYMDDKIILLSPDENKNFIYNTNTKDLQENVKSLKATFGDEEYYYLTDSKDGKTYYYFEKFDLYTNNIENIDLEKFVKEDSELKKENLIDLKIKLLENGEYMISYYDEKYGETKVKLFDENNNEKELEKEMFFDTKTRIVKLNGKENKEVWSYDKELNDKIYAEYLGM